MTSSEEKRHCCCCVTLPEGVALIGIYGVSFHSGLLAVQASYGLGTITATSKYDPVADDVIHPLLLVLHSLGIVSNGLLVIGVCSSRSHMMVPWLLVQILVAIFLAGMSLYYFILFPQQNCLPASKASDWFESTSDCSILLWHGVVMVLSFLILSYYVYIVQEFLQQMLNEKKIRKKVDEQLRSRVTVQPIEVGRSAMSSGDIWRAPASIGEQRASSGDIWRAPASIGEQQASSGDIGRASVIIRDERLDSEDTIWRAPSRIEEQRASSGDIRRAPVTIEEQRASSGVIWRAPTTRIEDQSPQSITVQPIEVGAAFENIREVPAD